MNTAQVPLFEIETDGISQSLIEQIQARGFEPSRMQVDEAVAIIDKHMRREASNRRTESLWPEDLCPAQKLEMIRDLARLLRE